MKCLLTIMSSLEISDGVFTDFAVGKGLVNEANPLMDSVVSGGHFLFLKVAGALVCAVILWLLYRKYPRLAKTASSVIITFYAAVIAWNAFLLLGS
ncbi:MAG: hypothetical protein JSU58_04695 [Dehalococcoidales bacterium]|nr:MAG: hypothetical protein JSU58_04695 [Dehalococcoidales bacterium]